MLIRDTISIIFLSTITTSGICFGKPAYVYIEIS